MGLRFPNDLEAWAKWQQSRTPWRSLRGRFAGEPQARLNLAINGDSPQVLVAVDAVKGSLLASLIRPLEFLTGTSVAVVSTHDLRDYLPGETWSVASHTGYELPEILTGIKATLASGHYLPVGAVAHEWSRQLDAAFMVVQDGLITPHAPPLPEHCHLLAFSEMDSDFWSSGRHDVTAQVVGSQLFWDAKHRPSAELDPDAPPVFLGQLHGAELPRSGFARAATQFCTATGAMYRPHPSETDRLSRLQHALWERRGIKLDRSGIPLAELDAPIASVFSTGVLEAAARGIPAWVTYPSPPAWLEEFWERYGMSRWGSEPTPAPARPDVEPARAIAETINHQMREVS